MPNRTLRAALAALVLATLMLPLAACATSDPEILRGSMAGSRPAEAPSAAPAARGGADGQPSSVLASSLTYDELWRRVLEQLKVEGAPMGLADLRYMLGVPVEAAQAGRWVRLAPRASADQGGAIRFRFASYPCGDWGRYPPDRAFCSPNAEIMELILINPAAPADSARWPSVPAPRADCLYNDEVKEQLAGVGWRSVIPLADAPVQRAHSLFDIMAAPAGTVELWPDPQVVSDCVFRMTIRRLDRRLSPSRPLKRQ